MQVIVGKTGGFCNGVKRSLMKAQETIDENQEVYCLGSIVHNKNVIQDLSTKGMHFINDIKEVPKQALVLFRAHGVSKEIYQYAKDNNLKYLDLTCPNVLKIHNLIREYDTLGYYIILLGKKTHPETIGSASFSANLRIIESIEEVDELISALNNKRFKNYLVLAQTTFKLPDFNLIKEKLEKNLRGNIKVINTICPATQINQNETLKLAQEVDAMIIIGGKDSSNSKALYDIAKAQCSNSQIIESAEELNMDCLTSLKKIGLMAGASTPDRDIKKVLEKLEDYN